MYVMDQTAPKPKINFFIFIGADESQGKLVNGNISIQQHDHDASVLQPPIVESKISDFSLDDSDRELFNHCISTAVVSARNRPHNTSSADRLHSRSVSRQSSSTDTVSKPIENTARHSDPDMSTLDDVISSLSFAQSSKTVSTQSTKMSSEARFWCFFVLGVFVRLILSTSFGADYVQVSSKISF